MLAVRGLKKFFKTERGIVEAVNGVNFEARQGEFYTLLGPSGCGKTTTLQCVAGLESPDDGEIELARTPVFSRIRNIDLPAHVRDIAMVFQSYAIWPHMTVYENVVYPLIHGRRKVSKRVASERVMNALRLVELENLASRPAPFLSGGQQQRVALARALVDEPKVLLLDEPLSNLDAKLREGMRSELRQLIKRLNVTTIYVTHDQIEALSMSDRVAVMLNGIIVQEGRPREVYLAPRNLFVANFVGKINLMEGRVRRSREDAGEIVLELKLGELRCMDPIDLAEGSQLLVALRPEAILVAKTPDVRFSSCANIIEGRVTASSFYGDHVEYQVEVNGQLVWVRADVYTEVQVGDRVCLGIPSERIVVISDSAGDPRCTARVLAGQS